MTEEEKRRPPSTRAHLDAARDIGEEMIPIKTALRMLDSIQEMRRRTELEITEELKNRKPDRSEIES